MALFCCVAISNVGYFLLSICNSLAVAKTANTISYFGGAFSMLVMLLIIYDVCQMQKRKWLTWNLLCISILVFALAASGDSLGLYYRSVSLEIVNGITYLVKDYGPLHILYAVYLASYVILMLLCIIYAAKVNRLSSPKYTLFLLVTVLLNVGIWLVEQAISEEFEFLSISYMLTELLLLLIYNMLCDYGIIHPEAGILGTFNYTDGTTKTYTAQFNPDTDSTVSWQYSAQVMVAEKAYSSIQVKICYDYNVNTAYFDGIQLFKETFGSSYTYDDEGNILSVKDDQSELTVAGLAVGGGQGRRVALRPARQNEGITALAADLHILDGTLLGIGIAHNFVHMAVQLRCAGGKGAAAAVRQQGSAH